MNHLKTREMNPFAVAYATENNGTQTVNEEKTNVNENVNISGEI